jgi:hypothetical protein
LESRIRYETWRLWAMCWEGIMSMSGTMVKGVGQACFAVFRARFCGYLVTHTKGGVYKSFWKRTEN